MKWRHKSHKTVFILGAGATRGAVPHVLVNRKRIRPPLNRDFFSILETLAKANIDDHRISSRFYRLKKSIEHDFPSRGDWPVPMETAFSLLYISKDFPEIFSKASGRYRQPGSREEIEDFLRLTFSLLNAIGAGAAIDNLYSKLVSKLEPDDTLITLNYDTVLDGALLTQGWDPVNGYCLTGGPSKYIWHMNKPARTARLQAVKLLKLHGSLNWQVRGTYKDIHKVFEAKPSRVMLASSPSSNESSGFIRQIIPPIYGKFFQHHHWQHLWHTAYESVLEADLIVVIGCSLIDTDFHLTGILSRAMKERKSRGKKFVTSILVDRLRIRKKWERLLKGRVQKKFGFPTFAQFSAELARD
jgi:hypothetical protein